MYTEDIIISWENNILLAIKDLSDLQNQNKTWSGKDSNICSSFTETIALLYDTFDFEEFIVLYKERYGKNKMYDMLLNLDQLIDNNKNIWYELEEINDGYLKILNDKNWVKVTKIATKIVNEYKIKKTNNKL